MKSGKRGSAMRLDKDQSKVDRIWRYLRISSDLVFWGRVDSQDILPHGTPADVRSEVARRIEDLGPGYIPNTRTDLHLPAPRFVTDP
jgi:hypothetical protein